MNSTKVLMEIDLAYDRILWLGRKSEGIHIVISSHTNESFNNRTDAMNRFSELVVSAIESESYDIWDKK